MAVTDIEELLGGRVSLAWVSYPYTSPGATSRGFCYTYPQFRLETDGGLTPIEECALPSRGCVYTLIRGGDDATTVKDRVGSVVAVTLNDDSGEDFVNSNYDPKNQAYQDKYIGFLNFHLIGAKSQVEFQRLEDSTLGQALAQVVELEEDVSLEEPLNRPVALRTDLARPLTPWIMVERQEGFNLSYYGPFEAQPTDSGEFLLSAVPSMHKRILKIDAADLQVYPVKRLFESIGVEAKFVEVRKLNAEARRPTVARVIDWVSDEELVDALAEMLRQSQSPLLKPDVAHAVVQAIGGREVANGLRIDENRRRRMRALLDEPSKWDERLDVIANAFMRPENKQRLLDLLLSENYLPDVRDRLVNSEAIKAEAEELRQGYFEAAEQARAEAEGFQRKRDQAERLCAQAQEEVREARQQAGSIRAQAIASAEEELAEARAQRDAARAEWSQALEDLATLEVQAQEILKRVDGNTIGVVNNLLQRRIIGHLNGNYPFGAEEADVMRGRGSAPACVAGAPQEEHEELAQAPLPRPRADEDKLTAEQVVSELRQSILSAGRDLAENDVVNLMVCLMSSPITIFSGLPGTGKTSLANILAGVLGLRSPETQRYAKISVERGWASHRDWIGYYSPLTGQLEASNSDVFEAMERLNAEFEAAGSPNGVTADSLPFLFLLDEANLSVLENYWAPFLGNADEHLDLPTRLSMQGGPSWRLPSNTRWLATVNFDHTTEALSDRLLNRAWVINVEGGKATSLDRLLNTKDTFDISAAEPFSYRRLMEVFGPKPTDRIDDASAKGRLTELFRICEAYRMPVSPRVQKAIAHYVAVAGPLMKDGALSGAMQAADYAFAQRVLPSIKGAGTNARGLLESLTGASKSLTRTNALLQHMQRVGDSDGYYQFFA